MKDLKGHTASLNKSADIASHDISVIDALGNMATYYGISSHFGRCDNIIELSCHVWIGATA